MASRGAGSAPRVGARRRRSGNGGNNESEGGVISDSDLAAPGAVGVAVRPRKAAKPVVAAGVDQSTSLALVAREGGGMQPPLQGPPPFSASLLSCYGLFSQHCLHTLENFFAMFLRFGRKEIVDVLMGLSIGMMRAVETHTAVKGDMHIVNSRAKELFEEKQSLEVACGELSANVEELKVCFLN
jgi:hypothetical protein